MSDYAVFRIDDDNERVAQVGRVSLDGGNRLSVLEAEAESGLQEAVDEVNGADALVWKHATNEASESGRSKILKEEHRRQDPHFLSALQDNFRRWHMLELDLPQPTETE